MRVFVPLQEINFILLSYNLFVNFYVFLAKHQESRAYRKKEVSRKMY